MPAPKTRDHCNLTTRQAQVLSLLMSGMVTKQIADRLGISDYRVKQMRHELLVTSRTISQCQLGAWAYSNGYRAS